MIFSFVDIVRVKIIAEVERTKGIHRMNFFAIASISDKYYELRYENGTLF